MNRSESINELAGALAKAQAEISHAVKDGVNPHFRSNYADLASVWGACRLPLSKNGLSVVQTMETQVVEVEGKPVARIYLNTMLLHSSGQWISSQLPLRPVKDDPQGMGSCITYMRRYSLAALVGVAPDDDDDGESAMGNPPSKINEPKQVRQAVRG